MDRLLMENDASVIKSLNADLRAVSASLAAAEERVKALEAENERRYDSLAYYHAILNNPKIFALLGNEAKTSVHMLTDWLKREALQAKGAE